MQELSVLSGDRAIHRLLQALGIGDEMIWPADRLWHPDPWTPHIATAFWLVKAVRPDLLVGLDEAGSAAHAAFCQAIAVIGLPGRAFAICPKPADAETLAFHDRHYGMFATLLSADPVAARRQFADGGVDLLHLSGAREYAELRHLFDEWHGALSDRAVVVVHATNRREHGSGAWRLWQELAADYPAFEFIHGDGLGILGVGPVQPPTLQSLFDLRDSPAEAALVRKIFAARGEAFCAEAARRAQAARIDGLDAKLHEATAAMAALTATIAARDKALEAQHRALQRALEERQERDATIEQKTAEAKRRDDTLREREAALKLQNLASRQRLAERDAELAGLRAAVRAYRESTSWRVTAPLRQAVTWWQRRRNRAPAPAVAPRASPPATAVARRAEQAVPVAPGDLKAAMRAALTARLNVFLASGANLRLPTSLRPDVSIILVLHNQAELTFGCLTSIVECVNRNDLRLQLVIFDNNSTDATGDLLARVIGAEIIASPENLHFLRGVNRAAQLATGRHILLLNNDAQLFPNTLQAAMRRLDEEPDIGAIGGRIVLPDGRLQEAGSIIWQDGSCVGFARGAKPANPGVMFRRDVDYCSGAFLLTPRSVFERLGGFDERYVPAYYEEADYCVRLWQHGLRVVYDPDVVILHYEFGSAAATDEAFALMRRNQEVFRKRHHEWLAGQYPHGAENVLAASRRGGHARRVLMIEDRVPHVKLGSGYPRALDMLRSLSTRADVTVFAMMRFPETWAEVRASVPGNVEVLLDHSFLDLAAFLKGRRGFYDAIVVCRPHNMKLFVEIGGLDRDLIGHARVIYDAEAIFANRDVLKRGFAGDPKSAGEAAALLADEIGLARRAAAVVSVSPAEKAVFEANGVATVHLLGFALTVDPTEAGFAERTEILFVGAMHEDDTPNTDSLRWFAESVLPPLRRMLGSAIRLKVVGVNKVAAIAELDGIAFDLIGAVDDLRPHFATARILVAPTRFAAGIPHKIAQAAAYGVPVVATDLLARQIGWQPGRDLLAATEGEAFAECCARLYRDQLLWEQVRAAALDRCREDCAPERFDDGVAEILETVPAHEDGPPRLAAPISHDYADWIRAYDTLTDADRAAIRSRIGRMREPVTISVLVPLYNTPEAWLRRCIESVRDQIYPHWQLCLADDASPQPHVAAICREYASIDSRIRFVRRETNGHIAAATETALGLATGAFVALLDHDDELAEHALYMVADALAEDPALDLIYSDEDKIDERGTRFQPWFKSDWNYDLMLSQNAVVHLAVFRRSILREIGGFRGGFEGSQDYDTTLRFIERTDAARIRHLPFVLYHWRAIPGSVALATDQKQYPYDAAARAIQEHLDRTGPGATASRESHPGYYRVRWPLPAAVPRVTIIIPTKDKIELLRKAVDSIFAITNYDNFEILVVDNRSEQPASKQYLSELAGRANVRVLSYDQPYSFAALNNWAVRQTDAELIALVNNDVEAISADWLRELVAQALRPGVGAVGALLYYPDDTIQHAGIVVGIGGLAGHPHVGLPRGSLGYYGRAAVTQQFSAVTGACMVLRREVFLSVGGLDEKNFAIAFNDVDLCLRLRRAGYAIVWTPYAELYHHESASLGLPDSDQRRARFEEECCNLRGIWPRAMIDDPFYNPNLTITGGDFSPAFPPRARKPWRD